jgi:hypothetical protein
MDSTADPGLPTRSTIRTRSWFNGGPYRRLGHQFGVRGRRRVVAHADDTDVVVLATADVDGSGIPSCRRVLERLDAELSEQDVSRSKMRSRGQAASYSLIRLPRTRRRLTR